LGGGYFIEIVLISGETKFSKATILCCGRKWTELYNQRGSVERCNSRLKEYLTANDLHVGGIEKVKTHVFLNGIVLLASALALKQHKDKSKSMMQIA
jgi:hypothetical protein